MAVIEPKHMDGMAAMAAAQSTAMRKLKGERDTEFVKRVAAAYLNACVALNIKPCRN